MELLLWWHKLGFTLLDGIELLSAVLFELGLCHHTNVETFGTLPGGLTCRRFVVVKFAVLCLRFDPELLQIIIINKQCQS